MSDEAWIIGAAIVALSFASQTIRGVLKYRGAELGVYIVAVVVLGIAGAGISLSIDGDHIPLGIVIGVGVVEAAATITGAAKKIAEGRAKRLGGE